MRKRRDRAQSAALREVLLDAWAAGGTGEEVAAAHGVTRGYLGCLLHHARRAGDERAAYRLHVAGLKRPRRPGRRPGPTAALREAALDAWAAGESAARLADRLGLTRSAFASILRRGHRAGDPRAANRMSPAMAAAEAARRDAVLDAWAAGMEAPAIGAALGMRWKTASMIVSRARERGDPRAHRRQHTPAEGLSPSMLRSLDRASRRYGVTVSLPEDRP